MTFDLRLPIGLSTADLLRELRERLGAAPGSVELEVIAAFEPTWTSPDGPLARAVRENALTVRGEAAQPVMRLGATDARWFRAAGIPTVVYGPAAYNMGGANESITVDDLLTVARVHAGAIVDYFAAGEVG